MERTITFRKVSDRQDLVGDRIRIRNLGLDSYVFDRLDMFWANVKLSEPGLQAEVSYCIDRSGDSGAYHLSFQYGSRLVDSLELHEAILEAWKVSEEKALADQWWERLEELGYFSQGRYPNTHSKHCPHCNRAFEIGTIHPHAIFDSRIVVHHAKTHAAAVERSLKPSWGSGFKVDMPSLEEQGELDPAIVGRPEATQEEAWKLMKETYGDLIGDRN